jgi:signal transduction histidine kinase
MLQLRAGANPVVNAHPLDLTAVVRRVCAGKAGPRVQIDFESAGPVMSIGHEDRLEHVIGHLVQNAIDATEASGRVVVRVDSDDRFASVVVADDGVGMSDVFVRERLFKPFQTTKASGMGIGVYESSQYVSSVGGDILVESQAGAGTTVRVRLPLATTIETEPRTMKEETA